jgi:hypothetical protein
MMDVG